LTEHELDHVLIGNFTDQPSINKYEVESYKWVNMEKVKLGIKNNPQNYTIWFKIIFNEFYHRLIK